jgi:hypothetical protein
MVWFYERRGALIRCEARPVRRRKVRYELVIVHADGAERVERYSNADRLAARQYELQQALENDGWRGPYNRSLCDEPRV